MKHKDEAGLLAKACRDILDSHCPSCGEDDCADCEVANLQRIVKSFWENDNDLTIVRKTKVNTDGSCSWDCGWWLNWGCIPKLGVATNFSIGMHPGPGCPRYKEERK